MISDVDNWGVQVDYVGRACGDHAVAQTEGCHDEASPIAPAYIDVSIHSQEFLSVTNKVNQSSCNSTVSVMHHTVRMFS